MPEINFLRIKIALLNGGKIEVKLGNFEALTNFVRLLFYMN